MKRQAPELARLSRRHQLILDTYADGLLGLDPAGNITLVNPAATRMLGRRAPEMVGQDLHSLVHPIFPGVITCNAAECDLYAALRDGESHEAVEDSFFRSDGRSFPVEFSIARISDEDDSTPRGSVITFRDITERRAAGLAAEAERRYREAEAQNRAKDNFLATLSHELRTPMTSILGWVQFLRTGAYSEEELQEALETVEASGRLQARLIDDMLDVSRIVLGKFQVDLKPTKISEVVDAALTTARPAAQEREVRLKADTGSGRDAIVDADPTRMQQVIDNLLSNAIKFTPPGREVDLKLEHFDHKLLISVQDQGEGIEPSFLPHVFERLRQAEGAIKRSGLGLGLAIARHIVELHHGEITASSDGIGKGATFTVTLPIAQQSAEQHHEPHAAASA